MTSLEISLLIGICPIIYLLLYLKTDWFIPRKRIKTKVLGRRGEVIEAGPTHSRIWFDGGYVELYRNSFFTEE